MRKKYIMLIVVSIIMISSMSLALFSCVQSIKKMSKDSVESDSKTIAAMISNSIDNSFLEPVTVAEAMTNDYCMKKLLIECGEKNPEKIEEEMSAYLSSIRDGFGYQMVFVVSDSTKAYYTYDGISKIIDPNRDNHDIWYRKFFELGRHCDFDVDTDEANDWRLSVFVNTEILDDEGNILGIGGVSVDMSELQKLIKKYEEEYNVKINLIDDEGLIQVDTDGKLIEKAYLDIPAEFMKKDDTFHYESFGETSRVVKYMDELGWFLVVEDREPTFIDVDRIVMPVVIIFSVGLVTTVALLLFTSISEGRATKELEEKTRISLTDGLTRAYNRRAYEADTLDISYKRKEDRICYVLMDVNGLKKANDTLGHEAGDELILGAAECMKKAFVAYGKIYRTGGDEFVVIAQCSKTKMEGALYTFDKLVSEWHGQMVSELAVAKGVVYGIEHPHITIDEIAKLADERMYNDKEEYYRRTGKDRRKS